MAPSILVHWNVTGEATPVALFAGETSVVGVELHAAPLATVMVDVREKPDGQSPKRASTSQLMVPFGTAAVSVVGPAVAPMKKRSPVVVPFVVAMAPKTDRKSTRLNSSHLGISYAVFCLKKKSKQI